MGALFKALDEGVLLGPWDPRYTQVGFTLVSVQVCDDDVIMTSLLTATPSDYLPDLLQGRVCFLLGKGVRHSGVTIGSSNHQLKVLNEDGSNPI